MARMRSVKPEFWADEDLSVLCRDARLLYIGLWNLSDEHGRLRGDPRYIKGQIFPYDDDLTSAAVDELVSSLAALGKVRRYRVGNGAYLFLPNLARHQRLDSEKVESRLPPPPDTPDEPLPPTTKRAPEQGQHAQSENGADSSGKNPDSSGLARARLLSMEHVAGGIEHVAGAASAATRARTREAEPPDDEQPPGAAEQILGQWLEACRKRPPSRVVDDVGRHVAALLRDGIDPADVREGLRLWQAKGLDPARIPAVVNQVMNRAPSNVLALPARADPRPSTTDQRVHDGLALAARLAAQEAQ